MDPQSSHHPAWAHLPSWVASVARPREGALVVDQRSGRMLRVDGIGSLVLEFAGQFASIDAAAAELGELLGAPVERVRRDIEHMLHSVRSWATADVTRAIPFDRSMLPSETLDGPPATPPDVVIALDSLGCPIMLRLHGSTAAVLADMLGDLADSSHRRPAHVVDVWSRGDGWGVALDGAVTTSRTWLDDVAAEVVAIVTALAGLRHGRLGPGIIRLHASSVRIRGTALVISGRTDSGKSSTALRLTERGAAYLTDEACEIDLVARSVRGLRRPLSLKGPVMSEVAHLRPPWQSPTASRWLVRASQLTEVVNEAPLAAIAVLHRDGRAPAVVTQLQGLDAVEALVPMMFRHDGCNATMLTALAELAAEIPIFRVEHAGSVPAAAALLTALGLGNA